MLGAPYRRKTARTPRSTSATTARVGRRVRRTDLGLRTYRRRRTIATARRDAAAAFVWILEPFGSRRTSASRRPSAPRGARLRLHCGFATRPRHRRGDSAAPRALRRDAPRPAGDGECGTRKGLNNCAGPRVRCRRVDGRLNASSSDDGSGDDGAARASRVAAIPRRSESRRIWSRTLRALGRSTSAATVKS